MQPKNSLIILLAIVVIVAGYFIAVNMTDNSIVIKVEPHEDKVESYEISPGDVVDKIQSNEDIILLDVRTSEEYEEIHLEGAILLPVQDLTMSSLERIGLGADAKGKEIIIYCRSGSRSKTAYDIMKSLGYTSIKSVAGGMIHWEEDNHPFTETGSYNGPDWIDSTSSGPDMTEGGPRIFLERNFYDFGVIPQFGGVVEKIFTVKNTGDSTLVIGDITTSCSCTSASISSKNIEPGEEADMTVVFDPDFHEEPLEVFKRVVFIPTNDTDTPEVEVSIQVDIKEGI